MPNLSIRLDGADLETLKKKAAEVRIPPTIYARSLLIRAMSQEAQKEPRQKDEI